MNLKMCFLFLLFNNIYGGEYYLLANKDGSLLMNDNYVIKTAGNKRVHVGDKEEYGGDYAEDNNEDLAKVEKEMEEVDAEKKEEAPTEYKEGKDEAEKEDVENEEAKKQEVEKNEMEKKPQVTSEELAASFEKTINSEENKCGKGNLPKTCTCKDGKTFSPESIYSENQKNVLKLLQASLECASGAAPNCVCSDGGNFIIALPKAIIQEASTALDILAGGEKNKAKEATDEYQSELNVRKFFPQIIDRGQ